MQPENANLDLREIVFTIEYQRGADPIMDVFIDYPDTIATSAACSVTRNSMWRLDRISGPTEALSTLDDVFLDPTYCNECLNAERCSKDHHYETVFRDTTNRLIYTYESGAEDCPSVPHLAMKHLGDGFFCEATRRENQYEWRILSPDGANVGELYDTIQSELPAGLRVNLRRLSTPTYWGNESAVATDLPHEQRDALKAAVKHGYYETPRAITVDELSEKLEIPQSTLQYRLQRATAWLANRFISEMS